MGRRGGSRTFTPKTGEPFNIILSIQYRGPKGDDFKGVSFSSIPEVRRAIRVLRLEEDLSRLALPRLQGPECVFQSSFKHPLTLEVLYLIRETDQVSYMLSHHAVSQCIWIRALTGYRSSWKTISIRFTTASSAILGN